MTVMADEKPVCGIAGCGKPVRARSLCAAHYEAHYQRKVPMEKLMDPSQRRLADGVPISARVSQAANEKLVAALRQKKAKSKYALVSMILERWDGRL